MPSNLIHKGKTTSTASSDHLLHQLLFSHLGAHGHNIISYLHDIPDDRQCVIHLSGMLLLYKLLPVCQPGRRSFIRWDNPRVRNFGIPSNVAWLMLPHSLTPLSPISVEPCGSHSRTTIAWSQDLQEREALQQAWSVPPQHDDVARLCCTYTSKQLVKLVKFQLLNNYIVPILTLINNSSNNNTLKHLNHA